MPEENQKLWTKLVKRQSRTTWAVLGVALVALLLAVWWVPALVSGPEIISLSPDENDDDESSALRGGNPGYIHIRSVARSVTIEDDFLIAVSCGQNFQVKAIYATVSDPQDSITVIYDDVYVAEPDDDDPIIIWDLAFVPFTTGMGGNELLSMLQVEKPVGLDADMFLVIAGAVTSTGNTQDDWLTVTAVFETAASRCNIRIITDDPLEAPGD